MKKKLVLSLKESWEQTPRKWEVTKVEVVLDDEVSRGGFNHPLIVIDLTRMGSAYDPIRLNIHGQRELKGGSDHLNQWSGDAQDEMDTLKPWSRTYGCGFEMDTCHIEISAIPFQMNNKDRLAVLLAKKINEAIQDGNLCHVHPGEEFLRIVDGLKRLGAEPVWKYRTDRRTGDWTFALDPLFEAVPYQERANTKAAREAERAEQEVS